MSEELELELSKGIVINVKTEYLSQHPGANDDQYAFAYYITIRNQLAQSVQLINRYWLITDGDGKQQEVRGPGVVGKQPHIKPNCQFAYNSGAILDTPVGNMQGKYEMKCEDGKVFDVTIPLFRLAVPSCLH